MPVTPEVAEASTLVVPSELLRSHCAPAARTLIDILHTTATIYPDAPALDDGEQTLTYREMIEHIEDGVRWLDRKGVRAGDRVGIRMPSGQNALYLSILCVLAAGGSYVPVDADDPIERAQMIFEEAECRAIITAKGISTSRPRRYGRTRPPTPDFDAWVIFTSGSTGRPKGVAVTHRNAAAFVDAEARMFLQDEPIGPGDRVLAGLSVAFDASCEEMWLAWRHGACLVPAPRALVRSGTDLGPWLVAHSVTIISTVPTLAALWPEEALDSVRLLIFGGEACPPELAARLCSDGREVWNTYGPTETTVVACGTRMTGDGPVSIGYPLDGWDLAVVDETGAPVAPGEPGELVIGGIGLARYIDPEKDAEKYAPATKLGWTRAYRSGDMVRLTDDGLAFVGRVDDQVKIGGRRVELGEIDAALRSLPGVHAAAATVRTTPAGAPLLVGYLAADETFDVEAARGALAALLPQALLPRLVVLDELPVRTSGKVDRNALPWPPPGSDDESSELTGTAAWIAHQWNDVLGTSGLGLDDDFFRLGGGSLAAARLVSKLRARFPQVAVADLYDHPRLGSLTERLEGMRPTAPADPRIVAPTPRRARVVQALALLPLQTLTGVQWLTWLAVISGVAHLPWLPKVSWVWVALAFAVFVTPIGRMIIAVPGSRILLLRLKPGDYARGGSVHLRLWAAQRLIEASGAENLSGAPWMAVFARALGAKIGHGVDLHTLPPVTGFLELGEGSAIEPEVDLSGYWLDGDILHVGRIKVGSGSVIGSRSTLLPGTEIGTGVVVEPASAVLGAIPDGQHWAGSPAVKHGKTKSVSWPGHRPPLARRWVVAFGLMSVLISALPMIALGAGLGVLATAIGDAPTLRDAVIALVPFTPIAAVVSFGVLAVLIIICVRLLSNGITAGHHPVRSRVGWQIWATERIMDLARTYLFPLYSSLFTPVWLRLLGARVGKNTEISTALVIPKFTTISDGAFLADDTMVASYELGGGWMYVGEAKIGKRAFLGNSGIAAPGRKVPKNGLVAVLSSAPSKAKAGSSWLGSPPVRLRRRAGEGHDRRTYAPPLWLKTLRGSVETLRIIPVMISFALGIAVLTALAWLATTFGIAVAALLSGVVLGAAGLFAGIVTVIAKWLLVGRIKPRERPLWSGFVWRNEIADTFVETVAAVWFANAATGTGVLNTWLRLLGARIGRGVWCESYWLPEADLVTLEAGANVDRGCVVQTHLFHDRIMAVDSVTLRAGATLGPHGVVLPASVIEAGATVGPASLVLRGDSVPASTRWQGNPIAPWGP
ncbi:Pls/PosA family non-ribosomal peptide synthetase [Smaragdicoccus niigatensis]|uniref:Pls/PosA family non-ribosomal peptide synthetase n=1 Tax=Smaragdicoccus niigatensis TaxID=359359 RepID=UPI0003A867FA|nr:Pls/PosA family non-ribosomal peptide synthetase [Smaragdicoccus niigatensis]